MKATLTGRLNVSSIYRGITNVEDKIYVLADTPDIIKVFEDRNGFRFIEDIALNETGFLYDIVYNNNSKCVYISDRTTKCIWAMTTTPEHRLTKWLTNVNGPYSLSMTNDGQLMIVRVNGSFNHLEIYGLNATLVYRLLIPEDVTTPFHVVQTSAGGFIISHFCRPHCIITQLANADSQLHVINRFIPRNQSEKLSEPSYLSLDSDNNRLFVADTENDRVILFDSTDLTWSQVLVSPESNGSRNPVRLFYDASKKHLFVAHDYANVAVYEIN